MQCDDLFLDLIPRQNHLKSRQDSEYLILVAQSASEIMYLNENSTFFYSFIDGKRSVRQIISLLKQEFEVDEETLQNDFICFLRDLQWKRLIQFKAAAV